MIFVHFLTCSFLIYFCQAAKKASVCLVDTPYIEKATRIVTSDFTVSSLMITSDTPLDQKALPDGFGLVQSVSSIDVGNIKKPVVENMLSIYVSMLISFKLKGEIISNEVKDDRVKLTRSLIILVYESKDYNVDIPANHALIMIEFVYRFGDQSSLRYPVAFSILLKQVLTKTKVTESFCKCMVDHFNPNRIPIPYFITGIHRYAPIRAIQKDLLLAHYQKILAIDDIELYLSHLMFIMAFSIHYLEEPSFASIISDNLVNFDGFEMLKSATFYDSALEAIPKYLFLEVPIFNDFIKAFITESLILKLSDEVSYIKLGSLLNIFGAKESSVAVELQNTFLSYSPEACAKISMMKKQHREFQAVKAHFESLIYLGVSFTSLKMNHLEDLVSQVTNIIEKYPLLLEFYGSRQLDENFKCVIAAYNSVFHSASKDSNPKDAIIQHLRFKLFISLINLISLHADSVVFDKTASLSNCLEFFLKNGRLMSLDTFDLMTPLKTLLNYLILTKRHFINLSQYENLFSVLSAIIGDKAAQLEMMTFLLGIQKASNFNLETFHFIELVFISNNLNLPQFVSLLISQEVFAFINLPSEIRPSFRKYADGNFKRFLAFIVSKKRYLNRPESYYLNLFLENHK